MPDTAPLVVTLQESVAGQATAGTDSTFVIGKAPFAGTVTAASYTASADITGHASNNRTFSVINKGQAGAGTASVASVTSNASNSFTGYDEKALTLSATAANLVVAAGDVLMFNSDANASGVADPGGVVAVTISAS